MSSSIERLPRSLKPSTNDSHLGHSELLFGNGNLPCHGGGDQGAAAFFQQADRALGAGAQRVQLRRLRGDVGDDSALLGEWGTGNQ